MRLWNPSSVWASSTPSASAPGVGGRLADAADRQGAADDRLHLGVFGVLREFQRREEVRPVGDGHRRHAVRRRQLADGVGLDGAFQQRIGRTHPQVHELRARRRLAHSALTFLRVQPANCASVHTIQTKPVTEASARLSRAKVNMWKTPSALCSLFVLIPLFSSSSPSLTSD